METTTRAPRASYVRGVPSVWEWEEQKSLIYRLWITEDKKLPELQQTLYNLHGFYASHGQFMTMFKKWKYEKKISPEDAKLILAVKQKRPAKIERWIARKAFSKEEIENLEAGAVDFDKI
ncbi:hypothetical protein M7I_3836 [Glarea lozoyensis 74030]|uniref:Clr5 domain-containing protein n=1 Tax=Glarea lozoyensis (strain ATCC 74030 / MF5533) TaxID=1104152 RepID=H0EMJ8_GLAL7|nr:hypothetical protein M7I_3836 [Glarea lozoyensis 74030]